MSTPQDNPEVEGRADLAEIESLDEGLRIYAEEAATTASESLSQYEQEFKDFVADLNLSHFGFKEFLFLGGSHYSPSARCYRKNAPPPRSDWTNLSATARVLAELRTRLNTPIRLTSIYRNDAYNSCLSGTASESQHKSFRAADFQASEGLPGDWQQLLRSMRDADNFFSGGIGIYNTFVHVNTRGHPADWDSRT